MKNRDFLILIVAVISIFLAWIIVSYLGSFANNFPVKSMVIPFIWGCLFVYLYGKRHTYLALNSYIIFLLFLLADRLNFEFIPAGVHVAYLIVSIFSVFLFILLYQNLFCKKPRAASVFGYVVTFTFYVLPLFYIIYAISFNVSVSREVFYAISQTNLGESLAFVDDYISLYWLLLILLANFGVGFLLLRQEEKEARLIEKSLLIFLVAIFAALSYTNRDQVRLYSFAKNTISEYWNELEKFRQTQNRINSDKVIFDAIKNEKGEVYIVVIGESLNKENMGLYGYVRDTSPLLSEYQKNDKLLVFDNAYSVHTHTMPVLSQGLTESDQFNTKDYYDSLSVVNVLNKADVETFWVTNQQIVGKWDNLVSVIAHQVDNLFALNKSIGERAQSQEFDGVVIDKVKELLEVESDKNRVIFVHLMGNHWDYCKRFPENYQYFSGDLRIPYFGSMKLNKDKLAKLNCYDNSVLYNDYVVSSLISLLEEKDNVNGLLYFSDHADDVIGGLGHNATLFTFEMTQIPLVMWLSDTYKYRYSDKVTSLKNNQNSLFSNDRVYDTLIGLFNVKTEKYKFVNDLSSSAYYMQEDEAKTLHGKIPYESNDNYRYHQRKNITQLQLRSETSRIIPHRVNSVGKLKDVWFDGFKSFELDVRFGDYGNNQFIVGHDLGDQSEMSFENFLSLISSTEIKKIWVDFKNLTETTSKGALARLNYLDERFNLKGKLIIESGSTGEFFSKFKNDGWHISYYLPTGKIIKFQNENKAIEMNELAEIIVEQSESQKLSAVSFDRRLYPFVKKYLEPRISNDVVYHTWDLSLKLFDSKLREKIMKNDYYVDQRVKTILLPYKSPYNL